MKNYCIIVFSLYSDIRKDTFQAFWLGRLAFVSDGVSNNGRFEAERPPTSVGPPSGGQAATFVLYLQHQTLLSSLSYNPAYVLGSKFGFMKLLASLDPHCTQRVNEQHRPAGFKSRLVSDLLLPFIPTLIGLRAFDLMSSPVWWEAMTNIILGHSHNGQNVHQWPGRPGFNPRLSHTKESKNGT